MITIVHSWGNETYAYDTRPPWYGGPVLRATLNTGTLTLTPAQSGLVVTNEGDTDGSTVLLPAASVGLTYTVYVQVGHLVTLTAGAGDTIRIVGTVTAAAGSITSDVVGSWVTVTVINASEWIVTGVGGTWTF